MKSPSLRLAAPYRGFGRVWLLGPLGLVVLICFAFTLPRTATSQQPASTSKTSATTASASTSVVKVYSPDQSIVLSSNTLRSAGAIDSLIWNGKQFINTNDHGRMLQYAWQINPNEIGPNWNPTEAGSGADGTGNTTTSVFLSSSVNGNVLKTSCYPAIFYPYLVPGTSTPEKVSPELLQKTVTVGIPSLGMPNVIQFQGVITIPNSQANTVRTMIVEFPTPYLNGEFNRFFTFDPTTQVLNEVHPTDDVYAPAGSVDPYYSGVPCMITTGDTTFALGVYSNALPQPGVPNQGYAMNNYLINPPNDTKPGSCSKLDMLYYLPGPLSPGNLYFNSYVVVGSLQTVAQQITALNNFFNQ